MLAWQANLSPQSRAEQFLIVTMDADAVAHKARQVLIHGCLNVWPSFNTRHSHSNTLPSDVSQSYGSLPCGDVGNRSSGQNKSPWNPTHKISSAWLFDCVALVLHETFTIKHTDFRFLSVVRVSTRAARSGIGSVDAKKELVPVRNGCNSEASCL